MREIRFRAWDKFRKKLISNILTIKVHRVMEQPYLIVYTDKKINPHLEIKEIDKIYCNEFELMQFTGLKDKNGVEIYEGDIVKCTDEEGEVSKLDSDTGVGQVEWLNKWGFWNISVIENGLGDILLNGNIEVIGNIHENPELLESED